MALFRSAFSPETQTLLDISGKVVLSTATFSLIILTSSFVAFEAHPILAAVKALGALLLGCLGLFIYSTIRETDVSKRSHTSPPEILMALCGVLGFALSMLLTFSLSDRVNLSAAVSDAKAKVGNQAVLLDITPSVLIDLDKAAQSYESAQQYRDLVKDIHSAKYGRQEVLSYIIAARTLSVDASFVQENGLVRKSDEKALFDVALNRADEGDLSAKQWLMEQNALAGR